MALPEDLLALARHLASREPKRPRQATLRRAVSTAYYALFHLLASAGAQALGPSRPGALRARIRRAFNHAEMKSVCAQFQSGAVDSLSDALKALVSAPIEREFKVIADAFIDLQEARHSADYDAAETFTRTLVLAKLRRAENAFKAWQAVRTTENANAFLAALLLNRQWRGTT